MKDFLLIANKNCIAYKEFFPFIKDRKVNIGYTHPGDFDQPDDVDYKSLRGLTRWFTTLSTAIQPPLVLTKTYNPEKYPKYDNYDAINVDRVKDIPWDYDGVMGVPITVLDHNLDNVEIVWKGGDIEWAEQSDIFTPPPQETQNEYKHNDETWRVQNPYNRIFIKKNFEIEGLLGSFKEVDCNETTGFVCGDDVSAYNLPGTRNGPVIITPKGPEAKYERILIRRKQDETPTPTPRGKE